MAAAATANSQARADAIAQLSQGVVLQVGVSDVRCTMWVDQLGTTLMIRASGQGVVTQSFPLDTKSTLTFVNGHKDFKDGPSPAGGFTLLMNGKIVWNLTANSPTERDRYINAVKVLLGEVASAESKLAEALKVAEQRLTQYEVDVKALTQRVTTAEAQAIAERERTAAAELKAKADAESKLNARIAALEREGFELRTAPFQAEIKELPATEWSAGAVVHWLSSAFIVEYKAAKATDFIGELTRRSANAEMAVNGAKLLSLEMDDFGELKLVDLPSFASLTKALNKLRAESDKRKSVKPAVGDSKALHSKIESLTLEVKAIALREQALMAEVAFLKNSIKELTIERDALAAVAGVKE